MTKDFIIVMGINILYAIIGTGLGLFFAFLGFKLFDKLITPNLNEEEALKEGNIAVAIVIGALFIMIGLLIGLIISQGLS